MKNRVDANVIIPLFGNFTRFLFTKQVSAVVDVTPFRRIWQREVVVHCPRDVECRLAIDVNFVVTRLITLCLDVVVAGAQPKSKYKHLWRLLYDRMYRFIYLMLYLCLVYGCTRMCLCAVSSSVCTYLSLLNELCHQNLAICMSKVTLGTTWQHVSQGITEQLSLQMRDTFLHFSKKFQRFNFPVEQKATFLVTTIFDA